MTPERLVFGQLPPKEAAFRRRGEASLKEPPANQEVWGVYRLGPLLEKVLAAYWQGDQHQRKELKRRQWEILRAIWGEGVEVPEYLSPSIVAHCLRWAGYEGLNYPPAPPTTEALLIMMMGSAAHGLLLRVMEQNLPGRQETSSTIDEADLSGRIDFLIRNPKTGKYQVVEFKFIGDYPFRQVNREGLPPTLRKTKNIYQPRPEHRAQVLLYMWMKAKELDIACANILFI